MVVRQDDESGFRRKKLASAKKIIGEFILEMASFRIEKLYPFILYSERSSTKNPFEWKRKNDNSAGTTIQEYMNRRACLVNK
jgi:hypothetical protein